MPFTYPTDQKRLWKILQITRREELLPTNLSNLYRLMSDLQSFDTKNSTTLVDDCLAKMTAIEALDTKINAWLTSPDPRNVKSSDSYLEGTVEYDGQSFLSIWQQQKDGLMQELRGLIDPCGCFTVQHGYAEVIAT